MITCAVGSAPFNAFVFFFFSTIGRLVAETLENDRNDLKTMILLVAVITIVVVVSAAASCFLHPLSRRRSSSI